MSDRNWKTSQRKSRGTTLPITALKSITETTYSVSTTGTDTRQRSSVSNNSSNSSSASTSSVNTPKKLQGSERVSNNASSSLDIFQIIEEDCYKEQQQSRQQFNGQGMLQPPVQPPIQAFQHHEQIVSTSSSPNNHINATKENEDTNNYNLQSNVQTNEEKYLDDDDDDDAPIIYTHHHDHDDDSLSQITSSIAGNSMYSSEYMFSRYSMPSRKIHNHVSISSGHKNHVVSGNAITRGAANGAPGLRGTSTGGNSSVPGLDGTESGGSRKSFDTKEKSSLLMDDEELKNFFAPNDENSDDNNKNGHANHNNGNTSLEQKSDTHSHSSSQKRNKAMNNALNENVNGSEVEDDDLIDNVVNIYTNNYMHTKEQQTTRRLTQSQQQYFGNHQPDEDDDITLKDMYSLGPSISNETQRTSRHDSDATIGALFQEARLKAKSIFVKVKDTFHSQFGSDMSNSQQKKDDDAHSKSDETDYFGILMSSSFVSSPNNNNLPPHQRSKKERNQVNFKWISCLLLLIWLLLYLAKAGNDAALERNGKNHLLPLQNGLRARNGLNSKVETFIGNDDKTNPDPVKSNIVPQVVVPPDPVKSNIDPQVMLPPDPVKSNVDPQVMLPQSNNADVSSKADIPNARQNVRVSSSMDQSHIGMTLPDHFNNFLDIEEPSDSFTPFFWHIPRTAGATVNEILGVCYHLRMASNAGIAGGHDHDAALQVVNVGAGHSYVNVDVSSSDGLLKAKQMGLIESGLADVVVTSLVNEVGALFNPQMKVRMFALVRHPVERAASLFYFLQDVQWRAPQTFNEHLANISIIDFYRNRMGESNWMVRYLTNQATKAYMDESDLKLAKEILRRKCLIGLTTEKDQSFARFEKFFGWRLGSDADQEYLNSKMQWDWSLKHPHEEVQEGTELWKQIASHNQYDMELYEYARVLFAQQTVLL